jgi:hypothetical protein
MTARIVNEKTFTVWCSECPFSSEPTIYEEVAERIAAEHDAEKHPPEPSDPLLEILRSSLEEGTSEAK